MHERFFNSYFASICVHLLTDLEAESPNNFFYGLQSTLQLIISWYNRVAESEFKSFNTIAATVYEHHEEILNFFINRSTNASAESFNAKIKAFRSSLRGVVDIRFFLFRLTNIYA